MMSQQQESRRLCLALLTDAVEGNQTQTRRRDIAEAAQRWVAMDLPAEQAHAAAHDGLMHAVAEVISDISAGDRPALAAWIDAVLGELSAVSTTVFHAYERHAHTELADQLCAEGLLAAGLSRTRRAPGRGPDFPDAKSYYILALRMRPGCADTAPPDAAAAGRAVGTLLAQLRVHCRAGHVRTPGLGEALAIPESVAPDRQLDRLLAASSTAARVNVLATVVRADRAQIHSAHTQACELLDLLVELGRPAGLYRLDDLALEYQLTRPTASRDHMAALLDPLRSQPHLLATLRCLVGNEFDRRRTAAELNLHVNTVDYRLKRIRVMTGCDPCHPAGVWRLRAALIAGAARPGAAASDRHDYPTGPVGYPDRLTAHDG
jgi:hypothetical protein